MAEAYGKLTGRPGIGFVTRGPGAINARPGVHIAAHDSTPMIRFIGQVERGMKEREAFQEVDDKQFFGGMAKWVVEADSADRIPELVARAFRVAMQGRPGPAVVSLTEDVLTDEAEVEDAARVEPAEIWPAPHDMDRLHRMIEEAREPLVIVGGSRWTEDSPRALVTWSEQWDLPVATSFRRASLFPGSKSPVFGLLPGADPRHPEGRAWRGERIHRLRGGVVWPKGIVVADRHGDIVPREAAVPAKARPT